MVHDDDTSWRQEFTVSGADPLDGFMPRPELPSQEIQDEIITLSKQPGVGIERIFALFSRTHPDISKKTIAYVLQQERTRNTRRLGR